MSNIDMTRVITADDKVQTAKSEALATIDTYHAAFLRRLAGDATIEERDTWAPKSAAAEAYLAGTATATQVAMLQYEATGRGEDTPDVVAAIITERSQAYHALIGYAGGVKQKAKALVKAATTVEDVKTALAQAGAEVDAAILAWAGS